MKRIVLLFLILLLTLFCTQKAEKIEKIFENGVEIIINHIEPYKIKNEPSTFTLRKEFSIDLEREEIAKIGLTDIHDFDVDSKGNIYLSDYYNKENLIFKFNDKGKYLMSFCRKGEGPGELLRAPKLRVIKNDQLLAYSRKKIIFFNSDGSVMKEIKININFWEARYLENGNYVFVVDKILKGGDIHFLIIMLYDSQLNKIKELDRIETFPLHAQRIKGIYNSLIAEVNAGKIFTGSQGRDYEIYVYDFNGNLIRKIRKEYKRIPPSNEYKEQFLGIFKGNPRIYEIAKKKIYFPSSLPPFHYFLSDNRGRLYVMTYEKGNNEGEYMFDIFNPDGLFIGRKSLKDFYSLGQLNLKIKNDCFYCIEGKENGFQQLMVYKMIWH